MTYKHFRILTDTIDVFGGKCPLCQTPLEVNVAHECSDGKPIPVPFRIASDAEVRKKSARAKRDGWKGRKR